MYRYVDRSGSRKSVYARTLAELRNKEDAITRDRLDCINTDGGKTTMAELLSHFVSSKRNLAYNSKVAYGCIVKWVSNEPFSQQSINQIKASQAKEWEQQLQDNGRGFRDIYMAHALLKSAFAVAVEDDLIRKNPFAFKVSDVVENDVQKRRPLNAEQTDALLSYMEHDEDLRNYIDIIQVLLHTGVRASEFCGITLKDVDLKHRRVNIDKQLLRRDDGSLFVSCPKRDRRKFCVIDEPRQYENLRLSQE